MSSYTARELRRLGGVCAHGPTLVPKMRIPCSCLMLYDMYQSLVHVPQLQDISSFSALFRAIAELREDMLWYLPVMVSV